MTSRTDIVVTTIWEPHWLPGYLDDLRAYGREADVTLRIIGDRKTPVSVYAAAEQAQKAGFQIDCPSLEDQLRYIDKLGLPADFIPWNSDNRRNLGFLRAWESGADVMISIDDDNYCEGGDFVGQHLAVGQKAAPNAARIAQGAPWFNIFTLLDSDSTAPLYPRGYPYSARGTFSAPLASLSTSVLGECPVAVNAGLWLDEPDVDAVTRLALKPKVAAAHPGSVVLDPATWSPINTQNTAVMRAALPAYYYVRMGRGAHGMTIDRFGDILSGYFVQKCANHMGDLVRIGSPVARHVRTQHDLIADLYLEIAGIALTEDLLPWLRSLTLSGSTYADAYGSLAAALREQSQRFRGFIWDRGGREFLASTAECMEKWLSLLARLQS